ncbi:MAG: PIN domain-containing protein [Aeromonas sp.]
MNIQADILSNGGFGKILLIDLENCASQIKCLDETVSEYELVVICYAQSYAKIPLDWLMPLHDTINKGRLKIFKMANAGKNAADFGISFYAGMLMQQLPADVHFVIMSNDTGLDHVVSLLQSQNRAAERIGTAKDESRLATQNADVLLLKNYCSHLLMYKSNRPSKRDSLLNSINSKFKESPPIGNRLLLVLEKTGVLSMQEGKINYNEKKILEFSL